MIKNQIAKVSIKGQKDAVAAYGAFQNANVLKPGR